MKTHALIGTENCNGITAVSLCGRMSPVLITGVDISKIQTHATNCKLCLQASERAAERAAWKARREKLGTPGHRRAVSAGGAGNG